MGAAKEKFANGDFDKSDVAEMIKEKMGDKSGDLRERLEAAKEKFANGDFDKSDVAEKIKERRGGKGVRRLARRRFMANRRDSENSERPERRQRRSVEEIKEKLQAAKEKFANGDFDKSDVAEKIKERRGGKG